MLDRYHDVDGSLGFTAHVISPIEAAAVPHEIVFVDPHFVLLLFLLGFRLLYSLMLAADALSRRNETAEEDGLNTTSSRT